jgi:AcrR family transcriptional regulator
VVSKRTEDRQPLSTAAIVAVARRHLVDHGAAGLSLRAVARDLGVVSSAVYRSVATRDELLTLLIAEGYDALGAAVEAGQGGGPPRARFAGACKAIRAWALNNPHEYALLFGSPVPGYRAPEVTTLAAARVPAVLAIILRDTGGQEWETSRPLAAAAVAALAPAAAFLGGGQHPGRVLDAVIVWAAVFGTVSFEVFGRLDDSVATAPDARAAFFDACVEHWADDLGLLPG